MLEHIVAVGTRYSLYFMAEASARLGWAWEPREVTPGRRPVMEIAGLDQRLIGWQSTRRQQIADAPQRLNGMTPPPHRETARAIVLDTDTRVFHPATRRDPVPRVPRVWRTSCAARRGWS
jgi:hypothetical protein